MQYPYTFYNVREEDAWFFLIEIDPTGHTPSTKIDAGCYQGPMILMDHVNKALKRMCTDRVWAKVSYSIITQKMMLHMSPNTEFTIPYQSECDENRVRIPFIGCHQFEERNGYTRVHQPDPRKGSRSHAVSHRDIDIQKDSRWSVLLPERG